MSSLQEVADRAKVSIATVSRVLNKSDKVVPETRATVEQALRDLGYRPSRVARRLRMSNGRAHLVGLIIIVVSLLGVACKVYYQISACSGKYGMMGRGGMSCPFTGKQMPAPSSPQQ